MARRIAVLLIALATLFSTQSKGMATIININTHDFFNIIPFGTAAQVEGNSSDECDLFAKDLDPNGTGLAFAADSGIGIDGTRSFALAFAKAPGILPGLTITTAFTHAAANNSSDALAQAVAGGKLSFSGLAGGEDFDLQIDRFMINNGDATADMAFELRFKGDLLFSAEGLLDHGVLKTFGAFSNSDFEVEKSGSNTIANLKNTHFLIPFTVTASDIGQELPLELTQVFTVHSANGGTAEVSSVPEPSCLALLASVGMIGVGFLSSRRKQTAHKAA